MEAATVREEIVDRENTPRIGMQDFLIQKRGSSWTVTRMYTRFSPAIRSEEIVCYIYKRKFTRSRDALAFAGERASEFKRKDPKVSPRFYIVKKTDTPITYTEGK